MLQAHIKSFYKHKRASVTLEAALIFPILILLFYFFYMFLMACTIQMSMKAVAVTTVNSIAAQIHSIDKVGQLVKRHAGFNIYEQGQAQSHQKDSVLDAAWLEEQLLAVLPEPIYTIVSEGRRGNWWPTANLAATLIGKDMFEAMLMELPESKGFEKERLSLVYLQLPDIVNYTDATVKLTLQYELPYSIPFLSKKFIIREQASQRAWLPDARASNYAIDDNDMFIQVISITPEPVRPGNKARITVKTKPHTQLDIEITYKSGKSVAKNLNTMQANDQGEITWEWFVSGNTTSGLWQYHIKEAGGGHEVKGVFEVRRKKQDT